MTFRQAKNKLDLLPVSGDATELLRDFFRSKDIHYDPILTELIHQDRHQRITFKQWWAALDHLEQRFPNISLSHELGSMVKPRHLGILGYISGSCPNLLEALYRIERYQKLVYEGDLVSLIMKGDQACARWARKYDRSTQTSDEILLLGLWQFIRQLVDDTDLAVTRVTTIWPVSESTPLLEQTFGGKVESDREYNAIYFPQHYLTRTVTTKIAAAQTGDLIGPISEQESSVNNASDSSDEPLFAAIHRNNEFIHLCIMEIVRAIKNGVIGADLVAKNLALSERTLHRRLAAEGFNFRQLTLSVKMTLAKNYLLDSRLSILDIALLVGYSDQVAFTRAFKKNVGVSPKAYALQHSQE